MKLFKHNFGIFRVISIYYDTPILGFFVKKGNRVSAHFFFHRFKFFKVFPPFFQMIFKVFLRSNLLIFKVFQQNFLHLYIPSFTINITKNAKPKYSLFPKRAVLGLKFYQQMNRKILGSNTS